MGTGASPRPDGRRDRTAVFADERERYQRPVIDAATAFGLTDRQHVTQKLISSFRLHALFTIAWIDYSRSPECAA